MTIRKGSFNGEVCHHLILLWSCRSVNINTSECHIWKQDSTRKFSSSNLCTEFTFLVTVRLDYIWIIFLNKTLQLCWECPRAIWKIVQHAQQHDKIVWKFGRILHLWSQSNKHRRILWWSEQLQNSIFGEYCLQNIIHIFISSFFKS